jgi:hypothetical protein
MSERAPQKAQKMTAECAAPKGRTVRQSTSIKRETQRKGEVGMVNETGQVLWEHHSAVYIHGKDTYCKLVLISER